MLEFDRDSVSFCYPESWNAELEEGEDGWTVTVTSPQTAFALIALRPRARDPADLADQTFDAIKGEYEELDAENAIETVAGQVAIGHDIDFLTVDTASICRTRCLETTAGPLLVMTQVSELDRDANDPVLRAIVASLAVHED